jgi:hypothetical protein
VTDTEVYLLKDWGSADLVKVVSWEDMLMNGVGEFPVCEYDVDNLKWSSKAV